MGRYRIIRGVVSASGGVLPAVTMDATDTALAEISGVGGPALIQYDVNPAYIAPATGYTMLGKDRAHGQVIRAQRASVAKIAAEPLFKNMPAIDCLASNGGGSDLIIDDYWRNGVSFTFFVVATIDPVLKASPRSARLLSIVTQNPAASAFLLNFYSNGTLGVSAFGGTATIPSGSVPVANTPFIVWGQYNYGTNTLQIGLNTSAVIASGTPSSSVVFTTGDKIGIGGPTAVTASDLGWYGKIARVTMYGASLNADARDDVISALQAKYIS